MGRTSTACQTCAAIKAKCTGQIPCSRCQRLDLPCSTSERPARASGRHLTTGSIIATSATRSSTLSSPSLARRLAACEDGSVKPRARHTKSSAGCANCRRRRKKCDEKRPTCGDCERLNLPCLPRSDSHRVSTATAETVDEDHDAGIGNGGQDSDWSSEDDHDEISPALGWLDIIERENHSDLSSPFSSLAHSSALEVLPGRRASDTGPSEAGVTLPHIALIRYAGLDQQAQNDWPTGERYLLNHFLQSVARSMSMSDDKHNPFIRLIVPLAFESKGVRNALAALSATHLSKVYPDFEKNHLLHRNLALEDLKWRLERPDSVMSTLTTTLLLCLSEVCECHSRRWLLYLHGARALLPELAHDAPGALGDFLIDLYNYICCVSSVTSANIPRVWGKRFGLHNTGSDATHALFGAEPALYRYLARIDRLVRERSQLKTRVALELLQRKALAMETKLQNWDSLRDVDSEEKAAADALRWALHLRLREVAWPSLETASSQIQEPVDNINRALSLIRPGSRAEAHLLFPIFMAGVGSITKASRLLIEYRVHVAEKTNGFGSVNAVHRLLDILWRRENNGGEAGAWQDIVAEQMPGLMLF